MGGYRVTMKVIHGGGGIPLRVVRLYGMDVISSLALDMYKSVHRAILYFLNEHKRLEV